MNKLIYITESQAKMLINEDRESKNMHAAREVVRKYQPYANAMQIITSIRNDIPNSRINQCQYLPGITRMYLQGQIQNQRTISKLNNTLKILGTAHANEYDRDLNGMSVDELIQQFETAVTNDLENDKNKLNAIQYTRNNDYQIVKIDSFDKAKEYGQYTSWCVTHYPRMYETYTHNGLGLFYFCLRNGFENEPQIKGKGCPLDSYGLSMIAVSVNDDGSCNTITCRWNHDNAANDKIMTPKELSQLIGMNFYEVFKPYTNEEFIAMGIIPFHLVPELLAQGKKPDEIFEHVHKFYNGFARVELNNKCNLINSDGKLVSPNQWFDDIEYSYDRYGFVEVELKCEYNLINSDGKLISPNQWFDSIGDFHDGFARVELDNKYNFINTNGEILCPNHLFDDAYYFENGFARVSLNGRYIYIDTNGNIMFEKPQQLSEMKNNKRIYITESQANELNEGLKAKIKANHPVDADKVKHIVKYLDKTFKRGIMNGIGDDGFPMALPIVAMMATDGSVLRNMTDKQLFYLLQDRFKSMYDDTDVRDRLLKQVIKDWYPKKISKEGLLTVNMI